jgi:Flp pilus assembly protein TadD
VCSSDLLRQDDNNIYLLSNLGAAQFELGKLADCEKNVAKALKIDADDPAALTLLGILRFRQERWDDALTALSRSAQLAPNNADAQNYLGITLSQKGQRTAAANRTNARGEAQDWETYQTPVQPSAFDSLPDDEDLPEAF